MKKKLSLMLMMCFVMLALSACGTDPTTVDYNGVSYAELKLTAQENALALTSMTDETKEYSLSYGSDAIIALINSWDSAVADVGDYQKLGGFTVTKSGKTVSTEQVVIFEERNVIVTSVYSYNEMDAGPYSITADKVYTLSEKMSKAGINTLMGMGTVFAVLILISLIISCFNIFPYLEKKKEAKKKAKSTDSEVTVAPVVQQTPDLTDDLELVAVISAAIAASTGTSTDSFVVRSIHRR